MIKEYILLLLAQSQGPPCTKSPGHLPLCGGQGGGSSYRARYSVWALREKVIGGEIEFITLNGCLGVI